MQLKVYSEELFDRGILWYTIFGVICICIIILSIITKNRYGLVIFILIACAYTYFHIKPKNVIELEITTKGLIIENKTIARINVQGYVLEVEKKDLKLKNIVLLINGKHQIFTIAENKEKVKEFTQELENYIPRVGEYEQSSLEKLYRKIKL